MQHSHRARGPRRALLATLAVSVFGVLAAPAGAATVSYVTVAGGQQLKFSAAAREVNNVYWGLSYEETEYEIQDLAGNRITLPAGSPCTRDEVWNGNQYVDDLTTAICPKAGVVQLNTVLADQDDKLMYGSEVPSNTLNQATGGTGDDEIDDQHDGRSTISGDDGYDYIASYGGNDNVTGGPGNDRISGGEGEGKFSGGPGDDDISVSSRRAPLETTTLNGNEGDDKLAGWDGTDKLYGDDGHDTLKGYGGTDLLDGGEGDDRLDGDVSAGDARPGADDFVGGTGIDTADYSTRLSHAVNVSLDGVANDGQSGELDNVRVDVENIDGGSRADVLNGNGAVNTINGNGDDDVINGGGASDYLDGSWGKDQITGGTGDDEIQGSTDDDVLDGGDGIDDIHGSDGDDELFGADGADRLRAGDGFDDIEGGPGLDSVDAGPGNDTVRTRDNVQDQVSCGGGADLAYLDNEDVHDGSCPYVTRVAGAKVDLSGNTLVYTAGDGAANNVNVTLGNGNLTFSDTGAAISPGTGCVAVNANTVRCSAAPVRQISIHTGDLGDTLRQSVAIPTRFVAGAGNDTVYDSPAPDTMFGNDGVDRFNQAATTSGGDTISGGEGDDAVSYSGRTLPVAVSLDSLRNDGQDTDGDRSGEEGDWVRSDVEDVTGGAGADWLRGSDVGNILNGNGGADRLSGGIGRDRHNGGAGADIINSRDGNADTVICGTETDTVTADVAAIDTANADCERVSRG